MTDDAATDRRVPEEMLLGTLHARQSELTALLEKCSSHWGFEDPMNPSFRQIVEQGTGKSFRPEDNEDWTRVTRPILEAFFHAGFFLEMTVRYATLQEPPNPLPSEYAKLLHLYGLR